MTWLEQNRPYDRWLRRFLEHVSEASSNQDKELLQFLMDLPEIPLDEIHRLETMALNADQCVPHAWAANDRR